MSTIAPARVAAELAAATPTVSDVQQRFALSRHRLLAHAESSTETSYELGRIIDRAALGSAIPTHHC